MRLWWTWTALPFVPDRVAVLLDAVVLDEGQRPVEAVVVRLEVRQQVAVGLEHVDAVLLGVAHLEVLEDEAVGAVGADRDVLRGADAVRAAVALRRVAGLEDHVVRVDARALDLEVAPDARPLVRDPVPVLPGRNRRLRVADRAA